MKTQSRWLKTCILASLCCVFGFAGRARAENNPPEMTLSGAVGSFPNWTATVVENSALATVTVTGTDPDAADNLTLTAYLAAATTYSGTPLTVSASPVMGYSVVSFTISGTPDSPGLIIYDIMLNDGNGWIALGQLTIVVEAMNIPPETSGNGASVTGAFPNFTASGKADKTLGDVSLSFTDVDSDALTVSVIRDGGTYTGDPLSTTVIYSADSSQATVVFSGEPTASGTIIYTITVSDGEDIITTTLTLTIAEPNVAPEISVTGPTAEWVPHYWVSISQIGTPVDGLVISASDANLGDVIDLYAVRSGGSYLGSELTIDDSNANGASPVSIAFFGAPTSAGTIIYELTAIDFDGAETSTFLLITISEEGDDDGGDEDPVNHAPVVSASGSGLSGAFPSWTATASVDSSISPITLTAVDNDADDSITFYVTRVSGDYGVSFSISPISQPAGNGLGFTLSGASDYYGVVEYELLAIDSEGVETRATVTISVSRDSNIYIDAYDSNVATCECSISDARKSSVAWLMPAALLLGAVLLRKRIASLD